MVLAVREKYWIREFNKKYKKTESLTDAINANNFFSNLCFMFGCLPLALILTDPGARIEIHRASVP